MDDTPPVLPAASSYVDRSGWLTFFGVVQILLGLFSGLLCLFVAIAPLLPSKQEIHASQMMTGAAIYALATVVFIWLGIGVIRACRWARALSQLMAWGWLVCGVLGLIGAVIVMPTAMDAAVSHNPALNNAAATPENLAAAKIGAGVALVFMLGFIAVFCVVLPGMMAWFFGRQNVRATCDARHPEPSWTDACPPLVLFVCLWQAFGAAVFLLMSVFGPHAFPFFGVILTGWAASLAVLAFAVVYVYCAWLLYRLQSAGWWLALALITLITVSGLVSSFALDNESIQRAMGQSDTALETMKSMGPMLDNLRLGAVLASSTPFIILLLLIRKHFRPAATPQTYL
jgi:hypothetical protein